MEIDEQKTTYSFFVALIKYGLLANIAVLVLLAMFVA